MIDNHCAMQGKVKKWQENDQYAYLTTSSTGFRELSRKT
jgi:hypothetical protein